MSMLIIGIVGAIVVAAIVAYFVMGGGSGSDNSGDEVAKKKEVQQVDSIYEEVPIYFSSQTGTAERFSDMMAEDAAEFGLNTKIINLQDFDKEYFEKQKFAIFILATHYEGDPREKADLSHMNYLMYGLGDKTYKHFGGYSKSVEAELIARGAKPVVELEVGSDHQNTIEDHYVEWKTGILEKIKDSLPAKSDIPAGSPLRVQRRKESDNLPAQTKYLTVSSNSKAVDNKNWKNQFSNSGPYELNSDKLIKCFDSKVIFAKDLRQHNLMAEGNIVGRTLELAFLVPEGLEFTTAGNVIIYPENDDNTVEMALSRVGLKGHEVFELQKN